VHFHDVNHRPEESPRFRVVCDDGRSYLQGTDRTFDLIISEPSNPWIAGLSNLYSIEYYEVVRRRLSPRGILAQWIQTYSFSPADYALVARTLLAAFPHASLVRISDGDTILLASNGPMAPTRESAGGAQAMVDGLADVRRDLRRYFGTADVRTILLTHVILDAEGLRRLVGKDGSTAVNTDVNLRLEFDAPLRLFRRSASVEEVGASIFEAASATYFRETAEALGATREHAGAFHKLAFLFDKDRWPDGVRELIDSGLRLDPREPSLLADRLVVLPPGDPEALRASLSELAALSKPEAGRVALSFLREAKHEEARVSLEVLVGLLPESATAWTSLARAYRALRREDDARAAVSKALAIDPLDEAAAGLRREISKEE
jgi:spermidine synthase